MDSRTWEDVSIAEIAQAAEMSVGGVYARFASKEAILLALHERYEEERTAGFKAFFKNESAKDTPLSERVERLVFMVVDLLEKRRGVLRTFILHFWSKPNEADDQFTARLDDIYQQGAKFLLEARKEITHPYPDKAVRMAIGAMAAAAREALVLKQGSSPGALSQSKKSLKQELSAMVYAYLASPQRGAR